MTVLSPKPARRAQIEAVTADLVQAALTRWRDGEDPGAILVDVAASAYERCLDGAPWDDEPTPVKDPDSSESTQRMRRFLK